METARCLLHLLLRPYLGSGLPVRELVRFSHRHLDVFALEHRRQKIRAEALSIGRGGGAVGLRALGADKSIGQIILQSLRRSLAWRAVTATAR